MQQTFLSKLRTNGVSYLIGSLLLVLGVPLYQIAILIPQGYSSALAATGSGHFATYLSWISRHTGPFLIYRLLLVAAFACLWSLPFTLFRIIIAQEILGREDENEEDAYEEEDDNDEEVHEAEENEEEQEAESDFTEAWRGRGFAVLAAWTGLLGIVVFALATLASTIYLTIASRSIASAAALPTSFPTLSGLFTILTYTVGGGLLGLSCLLFGIVIARAGLKLWPGLWVAFGYAALLLTAFLISSAVGVATVSNESQSIFTTPAILLFALWTFWFGLMLVRLKPEPV